MNKLTEILDHSPIIVNQIIGFGGLALIIIGLPCLYLLPWLIAVCRNTKNRSWVLIVNAFFGFSVIGWFIALAMAGDGEKRQK